MIPLALSALGAGCALAPSKNLSRSESPVREPREALLSLRVEAAPDMNPGPTGRPSPVVLRVYQLRASAAFEAADFFSLYDDERATLGDDLVAREEFQLRPGQRIRWESPAKPGTRYVGAVVAFRQIERARWRSSVALARLPGRDKQPRETDIRILIDVRVSGSNLEMLLNQP